MELKQCLILGYSPLLLLNQNRSLYFNWYPLNYEAFPLWMMSLFITLWEVKALFPIIFLGIILVLWPGEFFICVYWLAVSWILWWIFLQNSAVFIHTAQSSPVFCLANSSQPCFPSSSFSCQANCCLVSLSPISLSEHSLRKESWAMIELISFLPSLLWPSLFHGQIFPFSELFFLCFVFFFS